jgi:hypothetical protein
MAGSEVGGTKHRCAGSTSGTLGCASSAAATGADVPTLERAACRPAAITVSALEPAGDHAACVASCSSLSRRVAPGTLVHHVHGVLQRHQATCLA